MSETETDETSFSTTDLYSTAVLLAKGFTIKDITREGPSQKVKRFHFDNDPNIRATIKSYINKDLTGNLREFRDAIEAIKDIVHGN